MSEADDVLQSMCHSYSSAVNASDSLTYSRLFTEDAIRMPPEGATRNTARSRSARASRQITMPRCGP